MVGDKGKVRGSMTRRGEDLGERGEEMGVEVGLKWSWRLDDGDTGGGRGRGYKKLEVDKVFEAVLSSVLARISYSTLILDQQTTCLQQPRPPMPTARPPFPKPTAPSSRMSTPRIQQSKTYQHLNRSPALSSSKSSLRRSFPTCATSTTVTASTPTPPP